MQMLNIYREVAEEVLAIPMLTGRKSDKEKFAGADATYTIEALMHDGQALQSGTSHNLGQHFTKAFEIEYLDRNNEQSYPYHTSWGSLIASHRRAHHGSRRRKRTGAAAEDRACADRHHSTVAQ